MQAAVVRNLSRQLAGEAKIGWRDLRPAAHCFFGGRVVKGRIDFDCGKVSSVKFQPSCRRQIVWIENAPPFFKTPGTGADADFVLIAKLQSWPLEYSSNSTV